jgi:hypothetical protein
MKPIIVDPSVASDGDLMGVRNFLKTLKNMQLKPISLADLQKRTVFEGLMSCSCEVYIHRGWCKHAFLHAKYHGIIRQYPGTMDPKPTQRKAKAGRPKKSKRGDALNRHG